jgi:hypothetical protein
MVASWRTIITSLFRVGVTRHWEDTSSVLWGFVLVCSPIELQVKFPIRWFRINKCIRIFSQMRWDQFSLTNGILLCASLSCLNGLYIKPDFACGGYHHMFIAQKGHHYITLCRTEWFDSTTCQMPQVVETAASCRVFPLPALQPSLGPRGLALLDLRCWRLLDEWSWLDYSISVSFVFDQLLSTRSIGLQIFSCPAG